MPRRVTSDNAQELLHATEPTDDVAASGSDRPEPGAVTKRLNRSSGRVRHDEKITVYISSEELMRLEEARLSLRGEHAISVDRGRLVREAVAAALDELDEQGTDSTMVQRLSPDK